MTKGGAVFALILRAAKERSTRARLLHIEADLGLVSSFENFSAIPQLWWKTRNLRIFEAERKLTEC